MFLKVIFYSVSSASGGFRCLRSEPASPFLGEAGRKNKILFPTDFFSLGKFKGVSKTIFPKVPLSYNGFGVCEVRGVAEHFGERNEPHTPCYVPFAQTFNFNLMTKLTSCLIR
ncbi:MAG: hypothetical protein NT136_03260 [Candidatus Moranbacteria bacterium]|nr:hypothetical protein [Candidatus Moranbacteria bacterium]